MLTRREALAGAGTTAIAESVPGKLIAQAAGSGKNKMSPGQVRSRTGR